LTERCDLEHFARHRLLRHASETEIFIKQQGARQLPGAAMLLGV